MCIWCIIDRMDDKTQQQVIADMAEPVHSSVFQRLRQLITSLIRWIRR